MAITYRSISTFATVTGSTTTPVSMTLNAPTGATTDDLLVACISFRGATTPSIPSTWNIINRTQVTGNTNTNNQSIGSGLMAWTKVSGTVDYVFGAVAGQQFPNLAFGYVVRIDGQDLTDPVAGTSVNTLSSAGNGDITTQYVVPSFTTVTQRDYIDIMLCMGGQEVTWSNQTLGFPPGTLTTGSNYAMQEIADTNSQSGADGSISVAYFDKKNIDVSENQGFYATTSAINARHSLMVASFGGPRPSATGYSFSSFF